MPNDSTLTGQRRDRYLAIGDPAAGERAARGSQVVAGYRGGYRLAERDAGTLIIWHRGFASHVERSPRLILKAGCREGIRWGLSRYHVPPVSEVK